MADKKLPLDSPDGEADVDAENFGSSVKASEKSLEPENRVIESVEQALGVVENLEWDATVLVNNAAKITNRKQGARPYSPKRLENQGKAYKTNISTRSYGTILRRVSPRLYNPLLRATYLTAAALPGDNVESEAKSSYFREITTEAIRSWPRFDWFARGMAQEVVDYGFVFGAFLSKYEWRPSLIRMDRGFIPRGTEIMDTSPPFFSCKWDYKPEELLRIARRAVDADVEGWNKDAIAAAVQAADAPAVESETPVNYRKWEELIREAVWNTAYTKGYRVVQAKHLFVVENSGKVSHYILWPDGKEDNKLLYEKKDAFESMADVVHTIVFGWGDGTVHGSWGAGHILYDIAGQVEKIRCDAVDNLRNANKMRLQVNDAKDINDVKTVVNDDQVYVSGAQFANNMGGISQNTTSYIELDNMLTRWMENMIGSYIPPVPTQSSDVKAAAINAAVAQEQEVAQDAIEMFLSQFAHLISAMTRRLYDPDSSDPVAKKLREKALERLTEEELEQLVNQPSIQSVTQYTPLIAQAKAQFAMSQFGNQLYKQQTLARFAAEGVPGGGGRFADAVVVPAGDQTDATIAQRQQLLENSTMLLGVAVPVATSDSHLIHYNTLIEPLRQAIAAQMLEPAKVALSHLVAHWTAGVATKTWPPELINESKSQIADLQKAIEDMAAAQAEQQAAATGLQAPPLNGPAPQLS